MTYGPCPGIGQIKEGGILVDFQLIVPRQPWTPLLSFPSVRDSYLSCSGFLITLFLIAGAIQVEDERRGVVRKLSAVEPDSLRCYAELDEIIPLALTSDAAIVEEMDADKAFRAFRQDQGLSPLLQGGDPCGQPDGNRGS